MRETGIATVRQDYIKRRILDNKAAQTETQEHCSIGQTEMYKYCLSVELRQTLTTLPDHNIIRYKVPNNGLQTGTKMKRLHQPYK